VNSPTTEEYLTGRDAYRPPPRQFASEEFLHEVVMTRVYQGEDHRSVTDVEVDVGRRQWITTRSGLRAEGSVDPSRLFRSHGRDGGRGHQHHLERAALGVHRGLKHPSRLI